MVNSSDLYYIYLRKSREDIDAEKRGEEETLARHNKILTDLAKRLGITISKTYKEVVSGETIASRPQMMQLLQDIESNQPAGVLVVEVERLARGNTRDQGLVSETLKYSHTKIITPSKTYDPDNEFDEEYFEFGLFMSRREYQTINRRLKNGKYAAASEGKWPWTKCPYGYERYKLPSQKGFSLRILPEESEIVKMIFQLYTTGTPLTSMTPISCTRIATLLNSLSIPSRNGKSWQNGVVRDIINNRSYLGEVPSGRRKTIKTMQNGVITQSAPVNKNCIYYPGLHDPIIDTVTFELAQSMFKSRSTSPVKLHGEIKNPLAGLLKCENCGYTMIRRPGSKRDKNDWYLCSKCDMPGSSVNDVMIYVIDALSDWLTEHKISIESGPNDDIAGASITRLSLITAEEHSEALNRQLEKAYVAFERDIYDSNEFAMRSKTLKSEIDESERKILELKKYLQKQEQYEKQKQILVPKVEHLLSCYPELSAADANILLKEIVKKITYFKASRGTKSEIPDFILKIYPRI